MNHSKIILLAISILSFSYSFSQTVEQEFSALDRNNDGKIDKTEFQNPPPPPPANAASAPKKRTSPGATKSAEKIEPANNDEERAVRKKEDIHSYDIDQSNFEKMDTNGNGTIDMSEFKLNHTIVRKRPGATRKPK